MSMRRLCLILLCGLVAVPAALAAASAPGDGVLELSKVNGNVVVTGTRGTLWGQIDKGRLVVSDPIVGDGQVLVSGAETKRYGVLEERRSTAVPTFASASPAGGTGCR